MSIRQNILGLCFGSLGLLACSEGGKERPQTSELDVTNGIDVGEEEFPAVVLIMKEQSGGESPVFCTAAFVNDRQAITAAHCLAAPEAQDNASPVYIMHQQEGEPGQEGSGQIQAVAQAVRVYVHPRFEGLRGQELSPYDLAVLEFPTGTAPASLRLGRSSPRVNSKVTLVGYGTVSSSSEGQQSARSPGIKRYGSNTIRGVQEGFLSLSGLTQGRESLPAGEKVATGSGDSGSPWLHQGELASVTVGSKIQRFGQGQELNMTYAVDLHSPSSLEFLNSVLDQ